MTANVQPEGDSGMSAMKKRHARQRLVSMVAGPLWVGLSVFVMRFWYRYRIADVDGIRAQYRAIRAQSDAPMLVCANHLTLVDSFLATWALGSGAYWVTHPDELPWNTPESTNFGRTRRHRLAIFLAKCIPITRGGAREEVAGVLDRVRHLLVNGETALIFPEAGRSRTGRVEESSAAWGVGASSARCRAAACYASICVARRRRLGATFPKPHDTMHVSWRVSSRRATPRAFADRRDLASKSFVSCSAWRRTTSMLGNDVVDLRIRRRGRKPFGRASTNASSLRRSDARSRGIQDEHARRWAHWAAKEAAYKLARQIDLEFRVLSHQTRRSFHRRGRRGLRVRARGGTLEFPRTLSGDRRVLQLFAEERDGYVHVVAIPWRSGS